MEIYSFSDLNDLASKLASDFNDAVMAHARSGVPIHIALSGGHTPKKFFELLAKPPYQNGIPWGNVIFYWGDERMVLPDNDESNYKMTNDSLLSHIHIPPDNIERIRGEDPPQEEVERYEQVIKNTVPSNDNDLPEFDWVLLGMGDDGHTASLFPGADTLNETERVCVVATHPQSGQKRISITLPVINNAKRVSFLVSGSAKTPVLKEILQAKGTSLPYPASMVKPSQGTLEWYVDKEAAPWL